MRAMILAAGRGKRLRPLTDKTPKPLLEAGGFPLIDYLLRGLAAAAVSRVVINVSWLGDRIRAAVGDGDRYGLDIRYSDEGDDALETGGGIARALPWLGDDPFLVVNGDIWIDLSFTALPRLAPDDDAHLVMVPNPAHHPNGDFKLRDGRVVDESGTSVTFCGIGIYRPALFAGRHGGFPLAPVLREAIAHGRVSGQLFDGHWWDVGTPERLRELDAFLTGADVRVGRY